MLNSFLLTLLRIVNIDTQKTYVHVILNIYMNVKFRPTYIRSVVGNHVFIMIDSRERNPFFRRRYCRHVEQFLKESNTHRS